MHIGYIYKTTNLINERIYIGKKCSTTFDPTYYGSGKLLHTAIKKYGKENFKIEIICWADSTEELNKQEINNIIEHKLQYNLYNIAAGGSGGDTTSNHPEKVGIINKRRAGVKQWHRNLSPEEKAAHNKKISDNKKGKSNGHEGFTHTDSTKQKMKAVDKSYTQSAEWKVAHATAALARKGKPAIAMYKPVSINGVDYESVKAAMIALNINNRATFYNMVKRKQIEVIYK